MFIYENAGFGRTLDVDVALREALPVPEDDAAGERELAIEPRQQPRTPGMGRCEARATNFGGLVLRCTEADFRK